MSSARRLGGLRKQGVQHKDLGTLPVQLPVNGSTRMGADPDSGGHFARVRRKLQASRPRFGTKKSRSSGVRSTFGPDMRSAEAQFTVRTRLPLTDGGPGGGRNLRNEKVRREPSWEPVAISTTNLGGSRRMFHVRDLRATEDIGRFCTGDRNLRSEGRTADWCACSRHWWE